MVDKGGQLGHRRRFPATARRIFRIASLNFGIGPNPVDFGVDSDFARIVRRRRPLSPHYSIVLKRFARN